MLYLLRLLFGPTVFSPSPRFAAEKPCSSPAACHVERTASAKLELRQPSNGLGDVATALAGWTQAPLASGSHSLHQSYFHAFTASTPPPISHSLVELSTPVENSSFRRSKIPQWRRDMVLDQVGSVRRRAKPGAAYSHGPIRGRVRLLPCWRFWRRSLRPFSCP